MLSLATVVGLLMALAVALEGGPRMIAALSIHLAVLIGVAAGSRVEGRATSAGLGFEPLPYYKSRKAGPRICGDRLASALTWASAHCRCPLLAGSCRSSAAPARPTAAVG
jgi:hypothetical protein